MYSQPWVLLFIEILQIHQYMTGRIKLLKNGEPIQKDVHLPELGYGYDQPAEHDQTCGTYGLHEFQLPHEECLEQFVCDVDPANKELSEFAGCIVSSFAQRMHLGSQRVLKTTALCLLCLHITGLYELCHDVGYDHRCSRGYPERGCSFPSPDDSSPSKCSEHGQRLVVRICRV